MSWPRSNAVVTDADPSHICLAWNWGAKAGFFYAGTNILCLIWCWFRLPETKDRSFGEIDLLFEAKVPARKFKYTQVDQFSEAHERQQRAASGAESPLGDEKKYDVAHLE